MGLLTVLVAVISSFCVALVASAILIRLMLAGLVWLSGQTPAPAAPGHDGDAVLRQD